MADGLLGLGSDGSSSLNQELIDELKAKERESTVEPIETDLEELEEEDLLVEELTTKTNEFLDVMKPFDLYVTGQNNAFDSVTADASGDSAIFDAADTSNLTPGTTYVEINQLAQKDVYQSSKLTDQKDEVMTTGQNDGDMLSIEIDGSTYEFETKDKTYEELVEEINSYSSKKLVASLEDVGDEEFRLVVKSTNTGLSNAITINQSSGVDLGFDKPESHTLSAQNMEAVVDGVEYNVSSNVITTQGGLSITGVELGSSTLIVKEDPSVVSDTIYAMVDMYNQLLEMTNDATLEADSPLEDKAAIRDMQNEIKNIMFGSYGLNDEENIFKYGLSFDQYGYMTIDSEVFGEALTNNFDDLEELFVGYPEKEGIGTQMKTYLDGLDGFDGLLYNYDTDIDEKRISLEEEKETATEKLDEKYSQMSQEFASATVLITQMENDFASLQAIINAEDS